MDKVKVEQEIGIMSHPIMWIFLICGIMLSVIGGHSWLAGLSIGLFVGSMKFTRFRRKKSNG